MEVSIIKIYYIIIGVFSVQLVYYLWPRKTKFPKLWGPPRGFQYGPSKYDWDETFRRFKMWLALSIPYLIIFALLTNFFGDWIGKVGLVLFAILSIITGFWMGPVKKREENK